MEKAHRRNFDKHGAEAEAGQPAPAAPQHEAQSAPLHLLGNLAVQQLQPQLRGQAPHDAGRLHAIAAQGVEGGGGPLPHLKQIQRAFGAHDLSGARAHTGPAAAAANAAMGAAAYARGNDIAFSTHSPDLHTAAHEAAHLVQQRGKVQLKSGVGAAGDAYERHADAVADLAVRGGNAEPLLDAFAPGGGPDQVAVQRKPVNTTTTPDTLPGPLPPESYAPPSDEEHVDAEGNRIVEDDGHWHLAEEPAALDFPIAGGYKYQLLPINPNAAYAALHARVQAIQAEQLDYATSLSGDMKYWFAKVYYFVTTHELEAIDAGTYQYPHMKMQEVVHFYAAYKANIDAWMAGNRDQVEAHWQAAFSAAEAEQGGTWYKPRSMELMNALLPSMQAHIRFDLPRALAACYVLHYAGIPGTNIGDFRSDFDGMEPVFEQAQSSLQSEINDDTYFFDPGSWGWAQDVGFPFIFHVGLEREHTYEKAERLERGMRSGETNGEFFRAMRTQTRVAHPNSGSDDFQVDGTEVGGDFDWMNQPGVTLDRSEPAPAYADAPAPPSFPERLYFKQGRGQGDDLLEDAIRDDQDLAPFRLLAQWTREVRDAELYFEGHASAEGTEVDNDNLASSRAFLVQYFMWRCGADNEHNAFVEAGMGETGATPTPEWRYVLVRITRPGTGRQQHNVPNPNLPSEVSP